MPAAGYECEEVGLRVSTECIYNASSEVKLVPFGVLNGWLLHVYKSEGKLLNGAVRAMQRQLSMTSGLLLSGPTLVENTGTNQRILSPLRPYPATRDRATTLCFIKSSGIYSSSPTAFKWQLT